MIVDLLYFVDSWISTRFYESNASSTNDATNNGNEYDATSKYDAWCTSNESNAQTTTFTITTRYVQLILKELSFLLFSVLHLLPQF